jgi:hypothetical protein
MNQNQQFEDATRGLAYAKESLDPARYAIIIGAGGLFDDGVVGYATTTCLPRWMF